jgi:autotransporter translocation and assembly factor TamB
MALLDRTLPGQPIDVSIKSSGINLGLLEGLTGAVTGVTGQLLADVRVAGTSNEPAFTGAISIDGAAFEVAATGAKYKNGRVGLTLTTDRVHVEVFHLEDSGGRPLEVKGSLGTRELRVGDLEIEIGARRFEVLRNDLGRLAVDAVLHLRGRFEVPQLTGELTIASGDLKVDEILQRALFPYSTEETAMTTAEGAGGPLVFNPWQLLALNLTLHVPDTLRLTGDNVQVTPGTPIGLGDINLRVAGDLYLYKDPRDQMYVSGSFDRISGTYAFQGRRFDIDPTSSIVFRGDSSPELYVGVTRTISGVQTRVTILGPMRQPELRLSSIPPLEASDILSLIVFNTSANDLTSSQQQQLAVRAGVLAAGFLATPLVSAISSQIGLQTLEIEPGSDLAGDFGAKLTVGQEIAPGLVARFSRQFGSEPFDEATVEYYLSRIIRLRATFSDAQALNARQPFRRVERAGIDLMFFFSF